MKDNQESDCCGAEVFGKNIYEDYDCVPVDVAYICSKCNKICTLVEEKPKEKDNEWADEG